MYSKEEHFLVKLLTNNAMQLEETVELQNKRIEELELLVKNNQSEYFKLRDKYDNAVAMLHNSEPVKQEIVSQPMLFTELNEATKSNDLAPHFKMHPTRRKLTTEQAQHAYNMVIMGNARMTDMAKKFNCHEGTIHNVINGVSYKEIDRSKQ